MFVGEWIANGTLDRYFWGGMSFGGRRFVDVTKPAGLATNPRETKTLGVAVLDYDGDGRPDLYFVNDRVRNRLFHNRGNGTFEEVTDETGAGALGEQPRAGMGVAVGDPWGAGRPARRQVAGKQGDDAEQRGHDGVGDDDRGSCGRDPRVHDGRHRGCSSRGTSRWRPRRASRGAAGCSDCAGCRPSCRS